MYHHKLSILIYSKNLLFKDVLSTILPYERFEHHFYLMPAFTKESFAICNIADIVIIDLPFSDIPIDLNLLCKKAKVKVFCQNTENDLNIITSTIEKEHDEIWLLPTNSSWEQMLQYYFSKLLKQIKLEADLRLTQNYLETAIDSIPDLVWFKDVRGAHLEINNSFCEAVGKTKDDIRNRGHYYIWDLKQEEYEQGEYVCLETEEIVLQEKKTCLFDEQVKSKNGLRQFKTYKSPLFDEDGEVMGTVGVAHDVTDLQNLSAEFEIVLDSMNFAGIIIDEKGQVMHTNQKFKEYFQDETELLIGDDYFTWRNNILKFPKKFVSLKNFELELNIAETLLSLEINEEALFDVFQENVGYFCIYRDITEHKKHLDLLENYQKRLENDVQHKTKALQDVQQQMIVSFADIIGSRDSITGGHIKRTSKYVDIIVNSLREYSPYQKYMNTSFVEHMSLAAPLHDIGKISISDEILNKPGKYLPAEYSKMKEHPALGGDILDKTLSNFKDEEYYQLARSMAVCHHERWDGTGYPNSLKETQIPLAARIMAVADVFDALVSKRPYKEAFTIAEAYRIIREGSGTQFDPIIVDAFLRAHLIIEEAV